MLEKILPQIILAYGLVFLVGLYDLKENLGIWKEILPVSISSFIQLFIVGFLILYLLQTNNVLLILGTVLLMSINASFISSRRFKFKAYPYIGIFVLSFIAIASVSYFLLGLYLIFHVIHFTANTLIPFAGLLIAASMRSLSLFFSHLKDIIEREKEVIEGFYALGSNDNWVARYIIRKILPTTTVIIRDMLKAAGIVHIPGVMVGLLLAGVHPLLAAGMQFLVLTSMLFSMFFTSIVFFMLLIKIFGFKLE